QATWNRQSSSRTASTADATGPASGERKDTSPKRKRGFLLPPSLALRACVLCCGRDFGRSFLARLGQNFFRQVQVRVDVLHVVVVVQRLHQPHHLLRRLDVLVYLNLRQLRDLGVNRRDVVLLQRRLHLRKRARLAGDVEHLARTLHVLGTGI